MAKFGRREAYYPGADARQAEFKDHSQDASSLNRGAGVTAQCCGGQRREPRMQRGEDGFAGGGHELF